MSEGNVKRIENNTHRQIILPPVVAEDPETGEEVRFDKGITLKPGMNTVPELYMVALEAKETESAPARGKKGPGTKRYPGRELLKQLLETVRIITVDGSRRAPQITIYTPEQAGYDRPDGPELPDDLNAYGLRGALELIKVVQDQAALKMWSQNDKRPEVRQAAGLRAREV